MKGPINKKIFSKIVYSAVAASAIFCLGILPLQAQETGGSVSRTVFPQSVLPQGIVTVSLGIQAGNETQKQASLIDVVHVIDMSGSMNWFSNIIDRSVGELTGNWEKMRTMQFDSGFGGFDILLQTTYADQDKHLRVKSPSGEWYGYFEFNPSCVEYKHLQYPGDDYLRVDPECFEPGEWEIWGKGNPTKALLIIGKSPTRSEAAKQAAKHFISLMQSNDRIGVVSFDLNASLEKKLTLLNSQRNRDSVNFEIDSLKPGGSTAIGKGIEAALKHLSLNSRGGVKKAVILLSDGKETENSNPLAQAESARNSGVKIYTIGVGEADSDLLEQIASLTSAKYYKVDQIESLEEVYSQIAEDLSVSGISNGQIIEVFPSHIEYIGNASMQPASVEKKPDGTTEIIWQSINLGAGQAKTISFDIMAPNTEGIYPVAVYPDSRLVYTDSQGNEQSIPFPEMFIQVLPQERGGSFSSGASGAVLLILSISNEKAEQITENSAVLSWHTNFPATCRLIYDFSSHNLDLDGSAYGFKIAEPEGDLKTFHSLNLTGLDANTTYYWRAVCDRPGEEEILGKEQTFSTLGASLEQEQSGEQTPSFSSIDEKLSTILEEIRKIKQPQPGIVAVLPSIDETEAKNLGGVWPTEEVAGAETSNITEIAGTPAQANQGFFKNLFSAVRDFGLITWLIIAAAILGIFLIVLLL